MANYGIFTGYSRVELISAEIETIINKLISNGISLYYVNYTDPTTCLITVSTCQLETIKTLLHHTGCELYVKKSTGFISEVYRFRNRMILFVVVLLLTTLTLYLPTKVLFISVIGNQTVPDSEIIAAASVSGIRPGISRREVRSEQAKNGIISVIPSLKWVGINTYGCKAIISVIEKTIFEDTPILFPSNIVADQDGLILSMTVTEGTAQFSTGQTVVSGQVLISGYIDCGFKLLATKAAGEVYAQTSRQLKAVVPSGCTNRTEISDITRRFSVVLGKKRINLWKGSGICPAGCGRMYREFYMTLPGGLILPIIWVEEKIIYYNHIDAEKTVSQSELSSISESYLQSQMQAGTIIRKMELFSAADGTQSLHGHYTCTEMIGRAQS